VLHDELEENNQPFYFHEFAEHASAHGLTYLCEADFSSDFPGNFPANVSEGLMKMAHDMVEMEQYMDFLRLRSFRRPLLVHEAALENRTVKAARVATLLAGSQAAPCSATPDLRGATTEQFKAPDGSTLTTDHPASKAALIVMNRLFPHSLPIPDLLGRAYDILGTPPAERPLRFAQDQLVLCGILLRAFSYSERLVELHTHEPFFTTTVSERPVASPWARLQAETTESLTNLRHERVEVGGLARFLLRQLDGTIDRAGLVESARRPVAEGALTMTKEGATVPPEEALATLEGEVEETLGNLARCALFLA
jgi:methyltransferase-like protein